MTIRRRVTTKNSTVLGYRAEPYWRGLLWSLGSFRGNSLVAAINGDGSDPHIRVPWYAEGDDAMHPEDLAIYRVRPKWQRRFPRKVRGGIKWLAIASVSAEERQGKWYWIWETRR